MVDKQRADREGTGQPKQKESKKGNGTENAQQNKKQPANQSATSKEKIDGNPRPLDKHEAAWRDALIGVLRGAGVEVVTDAQEGQRVLEEANGETRLQAKKRALETASVTSKEKHQPTVVSSAYGAKVLRNLDKLVSD